MLAKRYHRGVTQIKTGWPLAKGPDGLGAPNDIEKNPEPLKERVCVWEIKIIKSKP